MIFKTVELKAFLN